MAPFQIDLKRAISWFQRPRAAYKSRPPPPLRSFPVRFRARGAKSPWRAESLTRIDRCNDKWKRAKRRDGGTGPGCRVAEQLNSLHNFHGRQVLMRNARSPCDGSILLFRFRFRSRDSRDFARTRDTALIPIRWIGHVEETRLRAPTRLIFGSKSFDSYIYMYKCAEENSGRGGFNGNTSGG